MSEALVPRPSTPIVATSLLACGVLVMQVKLVPVFQALFAGWGESFSWPSRLAMEGAGWVALTAPLVGYLAYRRGKDRAAGWRVSNLLMTFCLLAQGAVVVDLAIHLPAVAARLRMVQ